MPKILLNDGIDSLAAEALISAGFDIDTKHYDGDELLAKVAEMDALTVRSATKVTKEVIDAAKKLKIIVRGGVGVDNIDVAYAESKGITVRNTPAASSTSVAECAIGLMFSIARAIPAANASMKSGEWDKKSFSKGIELEGKTLGIIGMGRIGTRLAEKAGSLGMTVIMGYDKFPEKVKVKGFQLRELDDVFAESDIISLHIPKGKDEPALIGTAEIAKMKKGVILINTARGGVIDEDALLAGLNSGQVYGAGIDVWVGEPKPRRDLVEHPKVVALPHIGAQTVEGQGRVGDEVAEILIEHLKK
ncbi:MAG: D-2-hydroxyacid dehydrogenase [Calditrichaeota bacterium]|nr:D-2-hydroxyacid dehydrogenase [Calditrichota bacterium]